MRIGREDSERDGEAGSVYKRAGMVKEELEEVKG